MPCVAYRSLRTPQKMCVAVTLHACVTDDFITDFNGSSQLFQANVGIMPSNWPRSPTHPHVFTIHHHVFIPFDIIYNFCSWKNVIKLPKYQLFRLCTLYRLNLSMGSYLHCNSTLLTAKKVVLQVE